MRLFGSVCILLFLPTIADADGVPFAVVVDGRYSQQYKDYLQRIAATYEMQNLHPQTEAFLKSPSSRYGTKVPQHGVVHFLVPEKGWQIQSGLFYLVTDADWLPRIAEAEVARRLKSRNIESEVQGTGNTRTIVSKGDAKKGKVTIRFQDANLVYSDRIVVYSLNREALQYSLKRLGKMAAKAHSKSSFFSVDFSATPAEYRDALISYLSAQASMHLQRRDHESPATYQLRRSVGD